jgi:serine/threonine-protein phosphatase 2A regulatory subunit B
VFEEPEDPSTRSFFSEIIASISDVKFSHSGRYILSRDYLTVKVYTIYTTAHSATTVSKCMLLRYGLFHATMKCEENYY